MDGGPVRDDTTAYAAGYSLGRVARTLVGGVRGRGIRLVVIVAGCIASAFGGLVPEDSRLWFAAAVGAAVLVPGVVLVVRDRAFAFLGATLYIAATNVGIVVRGLDGLEWLLWAVAAATILAGLMFMGAVVRAVRSETELERLVSTDATSIAFFVTMIAALTYGLMETYLDLPTVSMWIVWSVGMFTWAVASIVIRRRFI